MNEPNWLPIYLKDARISLFHVYSVDVFVCYNAEEENFYGVVIISNR